MVSLECSFRIPVQWPRISFTNESICRRWDWISFSKPLNVFQGDRMPEDSRVDLVEVLLRCRDSAATALENRIQSFYCELFPSTDESTGR